MFSMCSELTPRAPILYSRIAQFMQPCVWPDDMIGESSGFHVDNPEYYVVNRFAALIVNRPNFYKQYKNLQEYTIPVEYQLLNEFRCTKRHIW